MLCSFLSILNTKAITVGWSMSRTTTMTVRIGGTLSDFVADNVGEDGSYENVSE